MHYVEKKKKKKKERRQWGSRGSLVTQPKTIIKCIIPLSEGKISDVAQEKEKSRSFLALRCCACVCVGKGMINRDTSPFEDVQRKYFGNIDNRARIKKKKSTSHKVIYYYRDENCTFRSQNVYNYDNYPDPFHLSVSFPCSWIEIPFLRTSIQKIPFPTFSPSSHPYHLSIWKKKVFNVFLSCSRLIFVVVET